MAFLHRLSHRFNQDALAVVMIHGVSDLPLEDMTRWNPDGKHLHVSMLAEALGILSRDFTSVPLESWLARPGGGPACTLTFDDGYGDMERLILPLLERHRMHAALFPVVETLDGGRLWMDAVGTEESFSHPDGRRFSRNEFKRFLRQMTTPERKAFMHAVYESTGESLPMLNWDELRRVSNHPLITVGNHTLSHCTLSRESDGDVLREVGEAADRIRREVGSCTLLAYPHGGADDFDHRAQAAARATGHTAALSTIDGLAEARSDRWALPRISLSANTWTSGYFLNGLYGLRRLKSKILG
ncbi:MAG: polysaccharide deacetylase family protein [Planctomycetota bacterium]